MTRNQWTLVLGLLVIGAAPADARQLTAGARLGINSATLGGSDADGDIGSRTGIVAGALLRVPLGGGVSLQPELLYSQKGASFTENFFGEQFEFKFEFDYVEVPVLVRFAVPMGNGGLQPALLAGPTFAFELSCNVSMSGFGTADCDEDPDEEFKRNKFDIGVALGGGLDYAMPWGALLLDARYTLGLRTLDASNDEADIKHRVWSISAGVAIPLGQRSGQSALRR